MLYQYVFGGSVFCGVVWRVCGVVWCVCVCVCMHTYMCVDVGESASFPSRLVTPNRTFQMCAQSAKEMDEWVDKLSWKLVRAKIQPPNTHTHTHTHTHTLSPPPLPSHIITS